MNKDEDKLLKSDDRLSSDTNINAITNTSKDMTNQVADEVNLNESPIVIKSSFNSEDVNNVKSYEIKPFLWICQAMLIYAFGAISYGVILIGPRSQGFFCGDESIRMPYRESTIPIYWLYLICYILLFFFLILIEYLCSKYSYPKFISNTPTKFHCNNYPIPAPFVRIVEFFLISQLGFNIERFLLNITKYSIGKLRPHFLAVCKPSVNTSSIAACGDAATYVKHYVCLGKAETLIRDARLSFYSGHTSQAFYYAVFLSLYIHTRFARKRKTSVLFPLIYTILIVSAGLVGFSRINDYKHHAIDVLSGVLIGTFIAIFMVLLFHHRFLDINYDKPKSENIQIVRVGKGDDNKSDTVSYCATLGTQTTNLSIETKNENNDDDESVDDSHFQKSNKIQRPVIIDELC